ncbi:YybS family protein [Clostridium sp. SYSU_GA19001]|uniref:YybS family protein n=1 Tax=Clostridium caldaquaticum TaxID=2940653 RepID=UPI0020770576|nr:YybS family protein [Clostridium caldaquaticum]MCM8711393.1 YybS family protein [Clostridium caldaquaticum]
MENRKYNTKSTVEAGLISGIIIVLMLITGYVPVISFMGTLLLPIPVALLYIRHSIKVTLTAVAASFIITAVIFNPISALLSAISFAAVGITMGYCIKKDKSSNTIIALLTAVSLAVSIVTIILSIMLIQKTTIVQFFTKTINDLNETIKESVEMAKSFYASAGMSKEQLAQIDTVFGSLNADFIVNAFGAIMIMQAFFSALMNYIVAKAILKRLGYNVKRIVPFTEIYMPNVTGMLFILPTIVGMLIQRKNPAIGKPVLVSGQYLMSYAFMLIGLSVVTYFLKNRFNLRKGVMVLIILFTIFNPLFMNIYIFIGLADMLFDFRKINPHRIPIR